MRSKNMKAMVIDRICNLNQDLRPLTAMNFLRPSPECHEILVQVSACGVCHTELDEIEGRTPPARFPMIPGHQVVGKVVELGSQTTKFKKGDRVGIAWIFSSCQKCNYCKEGLENLCDEFMATGRDVHGGYAEYIKVHEDFAFRIPNVFSAIEAAPLLCAGAIGYRSLRLARITKGQNLGLTGFGASAHLVLKMVKHKFPGVNVYVFARSEKEREFAMELGAVWAGCAEEFSPQKLHAIIDTTPVWKPVVEALKNLKPNGRLVINAIRKEEHDKDWLMKLDYPRHLWMEKEIKSVANVAVGDILEFLGLAAQIPIKPEVEIFSLENANKALVELKERKIRGAKVIKIKEEDETG
jgi:alcohol dehydrogenase, propanol-preferring